jgi:hypothetical protein
MRHREWLEVKGGTKTKSYDAPKCLSDVGCRSADDLPALAMPLAISTSLPKPIWRPHETEQMHIFAGKKVINCCLENASGFH